MKEGEGGVISKEEDGHGVGPPRWYKITRPSLLPWSFTPALTLIRTLTLTLTPPPPLPQPPPQPILSPSPLTFTSRSHPHHSPSPLTLTTPLTFTSHSHPHHSPSPLTLTSYDHLSSAPSPVCPRNPSLDPASSMWQSACSGLRGSRVSGLQPSSEPMHRYAWPGTHG